MTARGLRFYMTRTNTKEEGGGGGGGGGWVEEGVL